MIPAIIRAATTLATASTEKKVLTRAASRLPRRIRPTIKAKPIRKAPSAIGRTPLSPTIPTPPNPFPGREGLAPYSHPGNLQPLDTDAKVDYGIYPKVDSSTPESTLGQLPPTEREATSDTTARLLATGAAV